MKLHELFKAYGNQGYVVALIKSRDYRGYPDEVEYRSCFRTFKEAVREKESLPGMDVIVCPPFCQGDVPPAETANYFRSIFGTNYSFQIPRLRWYINI